MIKLVAGFIVGLALSMAIWRRNMQQEQIKEAFWAIFILWGAVALTFAILFNVPLSPPTDWISVIFTPVYKPIVAWLKEG